MIEQVPYVPSRNQAEFTPAEPVLYSTNGVPGFSVAQAVAGDFTGLDGRDDGISSFESNKAIFRIRVCIRRFVRIFPPMSSLVHRA